MRLMGLNIGPFVIIIQDILALYLQNAKCKISSYTVKFCTRPSLECFFCAHGIPLNPNLSTIHHHHDAPRASNIVLPNRPCSYTSGEDMCSCCVGAVNVDPKISVLHIESHNIVVTCKYHNIFSANRLMLF